MSLGLVEGGAADSGATPAVTYNRDGVEDVRDAAGNVTLNSSIADAADGAGPVLLSAQTGDVDDDGRIDRLASTWSEPLDHADDTPPRSRCPRPASRSPGCAPPAAPTWRST